MPNTYKRTKVSNDASARRLMIDILTKYHKNKDISNRSLGLVIQALDKEINTKGLMGRPEIHKIDSLYQVGAPAREVVKYIAETGVGIKGYNTKVFTPKQLANDGVIKRMRDFYKYAKKRGLNHAAATGLMSMVYGETLNDSIDDLFSYNKTQRATAKGDNRIVNHGLFSFENLRRWDDKKDKGKPKTNWVEDPKYTYGSYQSYLKANKRKDSLESQFDYYLDTYLPSKDSKFSIDKVNTMSAEDASVYFMKNQKPGFIVDDSTTKTLRSRANFLFKSEFNNGGMIKNISTLKAYPRRRRYAGGGEVAFRNRFGDVQGRSYGAEKGIQGASTMSGLSTGTTIGGGLGAGFTAAAAAGAPALIGTTLGTWGGPIGMAAGALIGGLVGLFTGRKKRRKAKREAEEADRQRQIISGNERILQDELKLDNTNLQEGPLDIYDDSNVNGITNYQDNVNFRDNLVQPNIQGTPFNNIDLSSAFGRIAARCGGKLKRKRCGGKAKRYDNGGIIEETSSNTAEVNGPSHEQGGVPYGPNAEVEGGEALMTDADNAYVFSDTLKYNGTTFADLAKPLMKHKGYLESSLPVKSMMLGRMLSLTDSSTYAIDRNTNGRNAEKANADLQRTNAQIAAIQNELAQLYNLQESMKAESGMEAEPIKARCGGRIKHKCGGKIRKYYDGGQIVDSFAPGYDVQRIDNNNIIQGQGLAFTPNDKIQIQVPLTQTQTPSTVIQQGLRCGGRTRKYAGGGFISPGLISEIGGNLIGGVSQLITNKGLIDSMESMRVPETPIINNIDLETDINTDAEIGDINNTIRSIEKYVTDNTSNSQVARQSILLARTQGSRMRNKIRQDEYNKEVELRNRSRIINSEIDARNSQIRAENATNRFNHEMEIIQRRSQQGAAIGDIISSLGRSISTAYQSKFDKENLQMANLINVLKDDKSRDYIFNNMPKDALMRMFGISSLKDLKKIQGGSTVPKHSLRTKRLNRRSSVVPDAVTMPDYYYNFA